MRVLLADDHRLIMEGLSNLLAANGIHVVGLAADGREAVAQALALGPDLVLMDLRMPVCDGLAATRLIKAQRPEIKIVMLTTSAEDQDLFAAVVSGASGYLLKSISGKAFIEALHGLEEGVPPFSPGLAARLLAEFARLHHARRPAAPPEEATAAMPTAGGLTERQAEVLRLVASGLTYKEVGQRLALSERTVRYHMVEIMDRLHLEHRSEVLAYAGKLGLGGPLPQE
jgi:DNA-binding NarL/FixJ family response regulator